MRLLQVGGPAVRPGRAWATPPPHRFVMKSCPAHPSCRARLRYACERDAFCFFGSTQRYACRWARVRDISEHGIGLLVGCAFATGRRVLVQVGAGPFHQPRELPGRVVHAVPLDEATWVVGCSFDRELTQAELQAILAGD